MSIKDNFPSVGPSLSLNFARSKTLDPRITFSRPSTSGDATYMNGNGLIVTAAADEPRFDHKYENGVVKSLGLLVEEQRTNILQQSVATTSNWTGGTSNTTFSNLSLNALGIFPGVEVTSTTGEAWHRRTTGFNIPFVSGTEYAVTFYYREGTSGYARLQFRYNSQESYVQGPADGSSWSILQNIGSITDVTQIPSNIQIPVVFIPANNSTIPATTPGTVINIITPTITVAPIGTTTPPTIPLNSLTPTVFNQTPTTIEVPPIDNQGSVSDSACF